MVSSRLKCYRRCQGSDSHFVRFFILRLRYVRRLINICSSISITGLVVLGGHTRVEDPHANFRNAFDGTSHNGNGLATALIRVNFAYGGYEVK